MNYKTTRRREAPRLLPTAPACCLLLHRVFERLRGAELRGARGVDVNRLAGARIPALACGARLRRENAEAGDRHFVAALEAGNDGVDDALDCALGVGLRRAEHSVYFIYDICFIHENLLASNPHGLYGVGMGKV